MTIYFSEEQTEIVECRDDSDRHVGGVQVTPKVWNFVSEYELDWNILPKDSELQSLREGSVVGVHTEELGDFPQPYVVNDVNENPTEIEDVEHIVALSNSSAPFGVDTIIVSKGTSVRGVRADYTQETESRYVVGDVITVNLIPDLVIAELIDSDELKSILVSEQI